MLIALLKPYLDVFELLEDISFAVGIKFFNCLIITSIRVLSGFLIDDIRSMFLILTDVINRFATKVGDEMHLNYLYVMTVADINGTNPKLWNSWKAALIIDLYKNTQRALRRGLENPIDKDERIEEQKAETIKLLENKIKSSDEIFHLWSELGDDYFIQHSPDEIAWHTKSIAVATDNKLPLILIREMTARGGSEIFIYMHDQDNVFSRLVKSLGLLNLNILDARIITSINGFTLDTFIVLEENGETISGKQRKDEIVSTLKTHLTDYDKKINTIKRFHSACR